MTKAINKRGIRALVTAIAAVASTILIAPSSSKAQIPDVFKNLKVLPDSVSKGELISTMKGFTSGLGVRCIYCHVGDEEKGFSSFDFASDDKITKKSARTMMLMTHAINADYLTKLDSTGEPKLTVQCVTCHRGQNRPILTTEALLAAYKGGGVDSVISKYRELRDEYFGAHTYDFSEMVLLDVASTLEDEGDSDAALKTAQLNLEFTPESSFTYLVLGHFYASAGDTASAVINLNKALEINPDNRGASRFLKQLQGE